MTPTQAKNEVRALLAETDNSFYTDTEIYQYFRDAETILANKCDCTESTDVSITTVAATREYSLPSGVMKILRATWYTVKLKKIDVNDLDQVEGTAYGYAGTSGNPEYYYLHGASIGLSPIPDTAQILKLWKVVEPAELTSSSTTFTIPDNMAHYLVSYVIYKCCMKDNDEQKANLFYQAWTRDLSDAVAEWNSRKETDFHRVVKAENNYPYSSVGMI